MPDDPSSPSCSGLAFVDETAIDDAGAALRLSDGLGAFLIAAALIRPGTPVRDAVGTYDDVARSLRNLRERGTP